MNLGILPCVLQLNRIYTASNKISFEKRGLLFVGETIKFSWNEMIYEVYEGENFARGPVGLLWKFLVWNKTRLLERDIIYVCDYILCRGGNLYSSAFNKFISGIYEIFYVKLVWPNFYTVVEVKESFIKKVIRKHFSNFCLRVIIVQFLHKYGQLFGNIFLFNTFGLCKTRWRKNIEWDNIGIMAFRCLVRHFRSRISDDCDSQSIVMILFFHFFYDFCSSGRWFSY